MNRTLATFLLIGVLTGLLAALSLALEIKGYGFGRLGLQRLDGLANATTFIPLAALYAFAATLVVTAPIGAAAFAHANGTTPIHTTALTLLATIAGIQIARFGFGNANALGVLLDWRFAFGAAIIAAHLSINKLRRNALTRTVSFIGFTAAALACLYWTFRI
ncbi:hypothetical protein AB2N04_11160 [Nitratireductor sp. GISD-1A_MAKvit]|uniref:hypothetical protein n=1 Tax=Nitratireductor sp. GISD-1A_MAKvit TaxID=3234198 RepID=UPI003465E4E2